MLTVSLRPEAERDLDRAFWQAEDRAEGKGEQLIHEFRRAIDRILGNPEMYQVVHRGVRRALTHRFPYALFYRLEADEVVVIAFIHAHRSPAMWRSRADGSTVPVSVTGFGGLFW